MSKHFSIRWNVISFSLSVCRYGKWGGVGWGGEEDINQAIIEMLTYVLFLGTFTTSCTFLVLLQIALWASMGQ